MNIEKLIIVGAVGIGAYLLMSSKANAGQRGAMYPTGPNQIPVSQFQPGTPGWTANRQAMADQQQLQLIGMAGQAIGGVWDKIFGGPAKVNTGVYGPPLPPDYSATNAPFMPQTEAQILYSNTGYGEAWSGYGISTNTGYDSSQYVPWEG